MIVVVSGLPRSGTSMMMKMLEAGGIPVLTDHLRMADMDNPGGYYEFERAKRLPDGDAAWLDEAEGRAVKIITALLEHLPADHSYRILLMHRQMAEVLASQRAMLAHRGASPPTTETAAAEDEKMGRLMAEHVRRVKSWLGQQPHVAVLDVDYNALVSDAQPQLEAINRFLGGGLAVTAMSEVVDAGLYRQRGSAEPGDASSAAAGARV